MQQFNNVLDCLWTENFYYMIKNKEGIEIYDECFKKLKTIKTYKEYSNITYNEKEKTFYLCEKDNNKQIYVSNDLQCFTPFKINLPNCEKIKDLTYCKCYNSLLIVTDTNIYAYDLCKKRIKKVFEVKENVSKINDCIRPLECGKEIVLIGVVCCCKDIYVTYRINGICCISKLIDDKLDEIVYKTPNLITKIFIVDDKIGILISKDGKQQIILTDIDCSCDDIIYQNCKCEIIESVALIEKSIAKILGSESLKIKAAIDKSKNVDDLICINNSVNEVIYYVTILEFILTEKIKTVNNDCNDCGC